MSPWVAVTRTEGLRELTPSGRKELVGLSPEMGFKRQKRQGTQKTAMGRLVTGGHGTKLRMLPQAMRFKPFGSRRTTKKIY